jgi:hypothetical protein
VEAEALVTILLIGLVALALSAAGIAWGAGIIRRNLGASLGLPGFWGGAWGRA